MRFHFAPVVYPLWWVHGIQSVVARTGAKRAATAGGL